MKRKGQVIGVRALKLSTLLCHRQLCGLGLPATPLWALVKGGTKRLPRRGAAAQIQEAQARH